MDRYKERLSDVNQVVEEDLVFVLIENEVDYVADLRLLKEFVVCSCKYIQQNEAQFGAEVEIQLNFECLRGHCYWTILFIEVDAILERIQSNQLVVGEDHILVWLDLGCLARLNISSIFEQ